MQDALRNIIEFAGLMRPALGEFGGCACSMGEVEKTKMAAIMEARDPNLDDKSVTVELPEDLFEGLECNLTRAEEGWALSINTDSSEDKKTLLAAEDSLKARFQEQGLGDVVICS